MYKKTNFAFIFLTIATGMLLAYFLKNENMHLKINQMHHPFFDIFFKRITYLGDGMVFIFLAIVEVFKNKKFPLTTAIAALLTLGITSFCKQILFSGVPRPLIFFGENSLHLVAGVKMAHWNSFPSGHSITAFAAFILLFQWVKKISLKIICIFLAVLSAFSRVYLSQHFLIDIVVGAFLGTSIAFYSSCIFLYISKKIFSELN